MNVNRLLSRTELTCHLNTEFGGDMLTKIKWIEKRKEWPSKIRDIVPQEVLGED